MAITVQMRTQVSQLYVSLFGRAPDGEGLGHWVQQLGSGTSLADVANTMYATAPARAYYPLWYTNGEIIHSFYRNVFGVSGDTDGEDFWTTKLNNGESVGSVIVQIIEAALANLDPTGAVARATLENKIEVAQWYGEQNGNIDDATAILTGVTADPASVDIAKALGKTFSLTKSLDDVQGTSRDDVIIGSIDARDKLNTLSAFDVVNGGAGTDTLKIFSSLPTIALPNLSNVEIIEVAGSAGVTVNTAATSGVRNLYIIEAGGAINADAGAATDVSVAMKAAGAAVDVDGGKDVTVKLTDVAAAGNDVFIGTDSDAGGPDVGVAAAGRVVVETSAVAATNGASIIMGAIAVTGGNTISVTQKVGDASALVAGEGATTHTQGNVTITGSASTTEVTVRQGADAGAQNGQQAIAAVAEVASVEFGALTAGQTLTTNGLTFTAAKNLTAAEVAQAFANLAAGIVPAGGTPFAPLTAGDTQASGVVANGVYSGALTGWSSAAANGDTVVFTSTAAAASAAVADLSFSGSGTATVTTTTQGVNGQNAQAVRLGVAAGVVSVTDANATIKTITVDGYGNGSSTTGTTVLETLNLSNADDNSFTVAAAAATLALNLEKVGKAGADAAITFTAVPATLDVKSTGNNHVNLTAAATTILNVSGTGLLDADATDLAALRTVKVTESAGLLLHAGVADTVESVDTTGTTGTVTVSIDGTKATYAGGAGEDIVTLTTAAPTKVINTGAGDDRFTLANGTTAIGTGGAIDGGDGLDTLVFITTADAVTASGSATFATKVTGFERLELHGATGAQDVDVAALGNYDDVTVTAGNAAAAVLTLNNLSSGATIRLNDAVDATNAADAIVVNIKDANEGDADVLNVAIVSNVVANGTADGHGTIAAADVETINISVTDGLIQTPDVQNLTLVATEATQIVITGDTALNLTTATNQKVTLIDASELATGLTVTAAGGVATTIKGGTGNDVLIASVTDFATGAAAADILIGGAGNDILVANAGLAQLTGGEGTDLFVIGISSTDVDSYATVEDFQAGDLLKIVGASAFKSAKVDLGDMAEFQALADAAIDSVAVNEVGWFQFGGNTYVVLDAVNETTAGFTNGQDFIVKLTGLIDLGNASFNSDHATIALV